jgi:hypothetical protein
MKRFIVPNDDALLSEMQITRLLIQDYPDLTVYARTTYYLVPENVWNEIDRIFHYRRASRGSDTLKGDAARNTSALLRQTTSVVI